MFHGHATDVPHFLQKLVRARYRDLIVLDQVEQADDLVQNLAGDEAAQLVLYELHEGHVEHANPSFYRRENIAAPGKRVGAPFGLAAGQPGLHLFVNCGVPFFDLDEAAGQHLAADFVKFLAYLSSSNNNLFNCKMLT